jgi:hypothetical protein
MQKTSCGTHPEQFEGPKASNVDALGRLAGKGCLLECKTTSSRHDRWRWS